MIKIFCKIENREKALTTIDMQYNAIMATIQPYDEYSAKVIDSLRKNLSQRWQDFTAENRKLNIAIIGRVKAGKSTFLNTVLFGGQHVLPEAFTPKTATLTKIEYAEQNSLEVEYYSPEEWRDMERLADADGDSEAGRAAKELTDAVRMSGVDAAAILAKGSEREAFAAEDELMGRLNRYVGANGEATPLVKCVTLHIHKEELAGISIVDTPGLNDPVISRTQKTRDFLGLCDVVFFLSPASQFLDKNDVELLRAQLPAKGVARLVLVCSRFDDGLVDVIYDEDSLSDAIGNAKHALQRQAKSVFAEQVVDCRKQGKDRLAEILSDCEKPLFVSSLFHNMIGKDERDYNDAEANAFDNLNVNGDLDDGMMKEIGDISPVLERLEEVIRQKDETLSQKAAQFVPLAQEELAKYLADLKASTKLRLNKLETEDKESIERERKSMASRIHDIKARLEEYFGEMGAKMDQAKISIMNDLRQSSREYGTLATKTGTEVQVKSYRVSDSHWYNPFSWGKSHREYYTYETKYTYVDANDALENIRNYQREACSAIEDGFRDNTDVKSLKHHLLKLVVDNFNAADESYDPAYFRLLTEKTLNQIELPVMNLNVDAYISTLSDKFSGEVRSSSAQTELKQLLGRMVSELYDAIGAAFMSELANFKAQLNGIKSIFAEQLLKEMNDDFERLKKDCEDKEQSIRRMKEYVAVLEKL